MSEKVVVIYVSRQFRDKIKAKKCELTYEKFLDNLLENSGVTPNHNTKQKHTKARPKEVRG